MRTTGVITSCSTNWISTNVSDGWFLWLRFETGFYKNKVHAVVNKDPDTPINGAGHYIYVTTNSVFPVPFVLSGGYELCLWTRDDVVCADITKTDLLLEIEAIEVAKHVK